MQEAVIAFIIPILVLFMCGSIPGEAQTPKSAPAGRPSVSPAPKSLPAATQAKTPSPQKSNAGTSPAATAPAGVVKMFKEAQKFYDQEKYNEAIVIYDQILRKYPGHSPTITQYAKALYRLERIGDSYYLFARVNPQYLDADTLYEYAQSFYFQHQWVGALFAFERVPKDHALYDLSNYYGGICALRLRRFDQAEGMMEKALVLPDKLARSRSTYLQHLTELRLLREKQGLAAERRQEEQKGNISANNSAANNPAAVATPGPYVHKGFRKVKRHAKVGVKSKNQLSDFHGYGDKTSRINETFFEFKNGPLIPLPFAIGENHAAIGMTVMLKAVDLVVKGEEQRNVVRDDSVDIVRIQSQEQRDLTQNGQVSLTPWIEIPVVNDFWISLGGDFYFLYPDFKRAGRSGSRAGRLDFGRKWEQVSVINRNSYMEVLDAETKPISNVAHFEIEAVTKAADLVSLTTTGIHEQFNYTDETLDGPDASSRVSGELEFSLLEVFGLYVSGTAESRINQLVHGLASYGTAGADGQIYVAEVGLRAEPVSWFSGSIYQQWQKSLWSVTPTEAADVYRRNTVDFLQEFGAMASLNLQF